MNINSNHSNLALDHEINNCRSWLRTKVFDACGYSSEVLVERLMQRLVEVSLYPYALAISLLCKTTSNWLPAPGTRINCGRAFMEIGSGRITITPKQWLTSQFNFILHWGFCLLAILAVKKAGKPNLPAALVFGIGEEALFVDNNDERFVKYCRLGPIEPLRNGKRFFVQSSSDNISSDRSEFVYCRLPLISLLREAKMGFFGRVRLLANHLIFFFVYLSAAIRLPSLSLLGKDLAYSRISLELDKRGLIESIITTCSSYTSQPLWMRSLRHSEVHMIWYSQDLKPISYVSDNVTAPLPMLRWIRVNTHWVWTHAFAEYLRINGHSGRIEVVGPIIWYMPEINAPAADSIKLAIFDVPAIDDDVLLRLCGELTNYFHSEKLRAFVDDIILLKSELENIFDLPVSFCLKMKRGYNAAYDRAYFDYIEKLGSLSSISFEHHATNIYSLISSSHLVIVYPFSSPAYIADCLNVPSIYYDPTKSISRHDFGDFPSLINFANSPEALLDAAVSALSRFFPKKP